MVILAAMASELPEPGHLLFTYGTLMLNTGIVAVDAAMMNAGVILGRGYIQGWLYDLGDYPGAVPWEPRSPGVGTVVASGAEEAEALVAEPPKVWGRLMHLRDPAGLFAAIDPYEGFDAADPAGSEFVRAVTRVILPDTGVGVLSQVYFYNFPTRGRERIESGDYLARWQAKGRPAQGRIPG